MKLICDTDILSSLSKVGRLELLERAFPEGEFLISDRTYDELFRSKEEGYDFPDKVFDFCDVTTMDENEVKTTCLKSRNQNLS